MIPGEWLRSVSQERDGFKRLLDEEEGSISAAAYRVASAKCRSQEVATEVPSGMDVKAAARLIAAKVPGTVVPSTKVLIAECESFGFNVIS